MKLASQSDLLKRKPRNFKQKLTALKRHKTRPESQKRPFRRHLIRSTQSVTLLEVKLMKSVKTRSSSVKNSTRKF